MDNSTQTSATDSGDTASSSLQIRTDCPAQKYTPHTRHVWFCSKCDSVVVAFMRQDHHTIRSLSAFCAICSSDQEFIMKVSYIPDLLCWACEEPLIWPFYAISPKCVHCGCHHDGSERVQWVKEGYCDEFEALMLDVDIDEELIAWRRHNRNIKKLLRN